MEHETAGRRVKKTHAQASPQFDFAACAAMARRAVVRRAIRVMTGRVVWKKNRDLVSRDVSERSGRPCTVISTAR